MATYCSFQWIIMWPWIYAENQSSCSSTLLIHQASIPCVYINFSWRGWWGPGCWCAGHQRNDCLWARALPKPRMSRSDIDALAHKSEAVGCTQIPYYKTFIVIIIAFKFGVLDIFILMYTLMTVFMQALSSIIFIIYNFIITIFLWTELTFLKMV